LVFGGLFFPKLDTFVGTLAAYATFGAGFIARPFGGLPFGVGLFIRAKVAETPVFETVGDTRPKLAMPAPSNDNATCACRSPRVGG
jgi:hypothetical protein